MSPLLEREAELAAILGVSTPFRQADGSYRLDNVFRFAVARAH